MPSAQWPLHYDRPVIRVVLSLLSGGNDLIQGFDGIAGFKFLSRFDDGNLGNPDAFGLDMLPGP